VAATRVAVVDDDLAIRELLEAILAEEGYAVTSIRPGPDLVAAVRAARPAILVLDWRLGGTDGAAYDAIRADPALASVPILICTGDLDGMRQQAPRLATEPRVAIIEKPFQLDALLGVLDRMIVSAPATGATSAPPELDARLDAAVGRRGAAAQARAVIEAFRATGSWDCAELWLPERGLLRCVSGVADNRTRGFVEHSRRVSLVPGFGLPGRIVNSDRPAWIPDVREDRNFPRAAEARRYGVRCAVGVPISFSGTVVGVAAVYDADPRARDDELLSELAAMAAGLGPWLESARGALLRPDAISAAARRLAQDATRFAEVTAIDIVHPRAGLQRIAVAHHDPVMAEVAIRLEAFSPRAEGPVAVAIERREPQRMAVTDATLRRWSASPEHLLVLRALQLQSLVAAPLLHRDVVVGGITLSSPDPRWHVSAAATEALATLGTSPAADELGRLVLGRGSRR
jgi:CheY-like chemotaxis protein